jgi:bacterioferritin (cytochrome b1)
MTIYEQMTEKQERAIKNAKNAIHFFDKVKKSSEEERLAVGSDHWDWLESSLRDLDKAFP